MNCSNCLTTQKVKTTYGLAHFNNRPLSNFNHNDAPSSSLYNDTEYLGSNKFQAKDPNAFRARPIKHWRKSLFSSTSKKSRSTSAIIGMMDKPGSINYRNTDCSNGDPNNDNINIINYNITRNFNKEVTQFNSCSEEKPCNPITFIKSAKTFLDKDYCSTNAEYLHKRCKSFKQRQYNFASSTDEEFAYNANCACTKCSSDSIDCSYNTCMQGCRKVIYKPSNHQFSTQGAVSSGSRITKLKYDTITKNGNSFRSAYGNEGSSAASYKGTGTAPQFSKRNYQRFVLFRRQGHRSKCCD
jgi:hypothetical protein